MSTTKKLTPCAHGVKHCWQHSGNFIETTIKARGCVQISKRGKYKCNCGATKIGRPA